MVDKSDGTVNPIIETACCTGAPAEEELAIINPTTTGGSTTVESLSADEIQETVEVERQNVLTLQEVSGEQDKGDKVEIEVARSDETTISKVSEQNKDDKVEIDVARSDETMISKVSEQNKDEVEEEKHELISAHNVLEESLPEDENKLMDNVTPQPEETTGTGMDCSPGQTNHLGIESQLSPSTLISDANEVVDKIACNVDGPESNGMEVDVPLGAEEKENSASAGVSNLTGNEGRLPGVKESRIRPHWCIDYASSDEEGHGNEVRIDVAKGSGNGVEGNVTKVKEKGSNFTERQSASNSSSSEESDSSSEESLVIDSDSDDGGKKHRKIGCQNVKFGPKTKGELGIEDLPPIEDLHITVKGDECAPLGVVYTIVHSLLVIESLPNTPALNLDSVLFAKGGAAVGRIFDVFGPVSRPYYSVRFNSRQQIKEKGLEVGTTVYCAPQTEHTAYVFAYQLMKEKGSDASWKDNNEPPPQFLEYSDDEEEMRAKRYVKMSKIAKRQVIDLDAPPPKKPSGHNVSLEGSYQRSGKRLNTAGRQNDIGWHNRRSNVTSSYGIGHSRQQQNKPDFNRQRQDHGPWMRPALPLEAPPQQSVSRGPGIIPWSRPLHGGVAPQPPGRSVSDRRVCPPFGNMAQSGMLMRQALPQISPWAIPPSPSPPPHRFGAPPTFQPPVSPSPPPYLSWW